MTGRPHRATRYSPWVSWSAIVMVSLFGTMAADVAHVVVGIPYTVSSVVFSLALAVILTAWYVSERMLSIHSIRPRAAKRSTGRVAHRRAAASAAVA